MYKWLLSVVLIGALSLTVAEDAPLPLDHADAVIFSEESVPSVYNSKKKEKMMNKVPAKKEKFSASRGRPGRQRDSERTIPRKTKKGSRAKVISPTKIQKKQRDR